MNRIFYREQPIGFFHILQTEFTYRLKAPNLFSQKDKNKVFTAGNPIREELLNISPPNEKDEGTDKKRFTILVIGGSQGAHGINLAMIEAAEYIMDKGDFHVIHQTGEADLEMVERAYEKLGISSDVQPFYNDMSVIYPGVDIVVCRAGATTIAELTALGKPAVFVPFPFAADDHQTKNAQILAEAGAATIIVEKDLNGTSLGEKLLSFATGNGSLKKTAAAAKRFGKPNAAQTIVDDCYRLMGFAV